MGIIWRWILMRCGESPMAPSQLVGGGVSEGVRVFALSTNKCLKHGEWAGRPRLVSTSCRVYRAGAFGFRPPLARPAFNLHDYRGRNRIAIP